MHSTIIRNNLLYRTPLGSVWGFNSIPPATGGFLPPSRSPVLVPSPPPQASQISEPRDAPGSGLGKLLIIGGLVLLVAKALEPEPPARRKKIRQRNDEPLSTQVRAYIRERDGATCTYCGQYAPYGHVDHRVSRANGGSNRVNNLSWACAPCNQSKGSLNARQLIHYI